MKQLLLKIISDQQIYARFLNTLSLLEYIGARKILKSQPQESIDATVLAHVTEELRHAQVLKRIALKKAPDVCQTYQPEALFCGQEAVRYFQNLDHAVEEILGEENRWHAYLLTTMLIEQRATAFYKAFEAVLSEMGDTVFRGILIEEEKHLHDVADLLAKVPGGNEKVAALKAMEEREFAQLMQAFESRLLAVGTGRAVS
jgi:rubrerythrin